MCVLAADMQNTVAVGTQWSLYVASGFRRCVCEIFAFTGCHIAQIGSHRRFGTTYRSHLQGWTAWPLKMGPIGFPETSVTNYQYTLRNIPEERRSHWSLLTGRHACADKNKLVNNSWWKWIVINCVRELNSAYLVVFVTKNAGPWVQLACRKLSCMT
jgi:hypothetical protein